REGRVGHRERAQFGADLVAEPAGRGGPDVVQSGGERSDLLPAALDGCRELADAVAVTVEFEESCAALVDERDDVTQGRPVLPRERRKFCPALLEALEFRRGLGVEPAQVARQL